MIVHNGVRYWNTDDLAASLISRGLISAGGSRRVLRRRVQRWAWRNALSPAARTKGGASLYREDECWLVLDMHGAPLASEAVTH